VNPLHQLRALVEALNASELESQKQQLLELIAALPAIEIVPVSSNGHNRLSPREREVMTHILEGRRLKEIAANLDISVKTVTTHRSRLLRKLGIEDNLGLYRYGVRHGLIAV
jgi:two-component system invasion response regulator UvrY